MSSRAETIELDNEFGSVFSVLDPEQTWEVVEELFGLPIECKCACHEGKRAEMRLEIVERWEHIPIPPRYVSIEDLEQRKKNRRIAR